MKKYLILLSLILILACSSNEKKVDKNMIITEIGIENELTFGEYVNLLIKKNYSNEYPDINNIPE